jgi:very-short-patch-repair endonuclease
MLGEGVRRLVVANIRGRHPGASSAPRHLRVVATPAEVVLWEAIRDRRLSGLKFRRQYAIGPFVVDFVCTACKLIVELDGVIHDQQQVQDQARSEHLQQYGYRVLRFRNEETFEDLSGVLDKILRAATEQWLQ